MTPLRRVAYCIGGSLLVAGFLHDIATGPFERQRSLNWIKAHGQVCADLTDPTLRSYASWPSAKLLAKADPHGYAYLQSHPIMVSIVTADQLKNCEGLHSGQIIPRSSNLTGTDYILLNRTALNSDALMAVGLSHELVHVRYGDPRDPRAHRSFLSQLWKSEEGDAHERGNLTGKLLHAKNMPSEVDEYLRYIYPVPFHAALAMLLVFTFGMGEVIKRRTDKRIAGYPLIHTGGPTMRNYAAASPNYWASRGYGSWWGSRTLIQRAVLLFVGIACPPYGVILLFKIWNRR
jgi:hypothetical protein